MVNVLSPSSMVWKCIVHINNPLGNLNSGRSPGERSSLEAAVPISPAAIFNYHFAQTTLLFQISNTKKKLTSIITNFTLYNNTSNLSTIYLSILQSTTYCCDTTLTHAQLFLRRDKSIICCRVLDTHNWLFCLFAAASNSVSLANFQNGDQQKMSNTDDEGVSKFQLQKPSQKETFRYAVSWLLPSRR